MYPGINLRDDKSSRSYPCSPNVWVDSEEKYLPFPIQFDFPPHQLHPNWSCRIVFHRILSLQVTVHIEHLDWIQTKCKAPGLHCKRALFRKGEDSFQVQVSSLERSELRSLNMVCFKSKAEISQFTISIWGEQNVTFSQEWEQLRFWIFHNYGKSQLSKSDFRVLG